MTPELQARLSGIREVLMAHHRASSRLPNAAKGSERETLVREFLQRVFPAPYRFGSGAVADAGGVASGQLDVVVEFPFFASFPAPAGGERLYLAESVAFVIEVKSDLSSQWAQVEETTAKLRPLRRRWRGHLVVDSEVGISTAPPSHSRIPLVAVGFTGHQTLEGLKERLAQTPEDRRPDAALVIESGAYVGWQVSGLGEDGFFAFCVDGSYFVRNVLTADPDFAAYLGSHDVG
jgi:hypothetical protein